MAPLAEPARRTPTLVEHNSGELNRGTRGGLDQRIRMILIRILRSIDAHFGLRQLSSVTQ